MDSSGLTRTGWERERDEPADQVGVLGEGGEAHDGFAVVARREGRGAGCVQVLGHGEVVVEDAEAEGGHAFFWGVRAGVSGQRMEQGGSVRLLVS